jgi:pimeloyl-ACP methyl ester carboxylesterase
MPDVNPPPFVLLHGAWHGAWAWDPVAPLLEARGHSVHAPDLPGAGANARIPQAFLRRPLDAEAFATEPSPNASVTQDDRTRAVAEIIRRAAREAGQPVILVGHSLGGLTVTAAAEAAPEDVAAVVYVAALMLPPGVSGQTQLGHPAWADALVMTLVKGDPAQLGAFRLDPRSEDADYRDRFKAALYGDIDDAVFRSMLPRLHPDEPVCMLATQTVSTAERFGRIPRHYVRCVDDRAVPFAAQNLMISDLEAHYGPTRIHTLETSHSPFVSQPERFVELLADIARGGRS